MSANANFCQRLLSLNCNLILLVLVLPSKTICLAFCEVFVDLWLDPIRSSNECVGVVFLSHKFIVELISGQFNENLLKEKPEPEATLFFASLHRSSEILYGPQTTQQKTQELLLLAL